LDGNELRQFRDEGAVLAVPPNWVQRFWHAGHFAPRPFGGTLSVPWLINFAGGHGAVQW
jgi:hypothetical protein